MVGYYALTFEKVVGAYCFWLVPQWVCMYNQVLAHLSQRLIVEFIVIQVGLRRQHSLKMFSSETTGPVIVKFHIQPLWDWGAKVCPNGPGHMTKMTTMPIYGKNLSKSTSEPTGRCH